MNTMNQVKKSVFKNLEYFGPLWVIFSFLVVDPEFSYAGGKPPQGIQSRSYSTVEVKSPPILVPAPIVRQPKTEEEKENISKVKALMDEENFPKAEELGKAIIRYNPTLPEGYYYTALAQFQQEKMNNAAETLSKLNQAAQNLGSASKYAWEYASEDTSTEKAEDVVTQALVKEALHVVSVKKKFFTHLKEAEQAAASGFRGKQAEECFKAWEACPTQVETGYLAAQLLHSLGDTKRCVIALNQICKIAQSDLSEEERAERAAELEKVEKLRDGLSTQAQEEYKQLHSTLMPSLTRDEKMAILDELENLVPSLSHQVSYYKGWIFASEGNFDTAIPLFIKSLQVSHIKMKDFINFEYRVSVDKIGIVLSGKQIRNVLSNSKLQEFIGNYFGINAKNELKIIVKKQVVISIAPDDSRVSPAFAALGRMYQFAGLIWSGGPPKQMNYDDAQRYCLSLGGNARLPTLDELEILSTIMKPGCKFDPELFPKIKGNGFWSSTPDPSDFKNAHIFVYHTDTSCGIGMAGKFYSGHDVHCVCTAN